MTKYYILSLKHSPSVGGHAVWWMADNSGYTSDLNQAGQYDEETVIAKRDYYDNGVDTAAIEFSELLGRTKEMMDFNKAIAITKGEL